MPSLSCSAARAGQEAENLIASCWTPDRGIFSKVVSQWLQFRPFRHIASSGVLAAVGQPATEANLLVARSLPPRLASLLLFVH